MSKDYAVALTTFDNPYDPIDQFDDWYRFDLDREREHSAENYLNCCSYVARIANFSNALSDWENTQEAERAIDEIIKLDPFNIYKKVKRQV